MSRDGQVIGPEETGHSLDIEGLPKSVLSAIIRRLNEKSQRTTQTFNKSYVVQVADIRNLCEKISQEFSGFSIISMSASVSVFLSNSQRYDFSSWKDFEAFDASQAERTKSLSVEMIFDVVRESLINAFGCAELAA